MKQKIINVYSYDELSDKAKEKAREWYREYGLDYEWWDFCIDDFKEIGKILGFKIKNVYFGLFSKSHHIGFPSTYSYEKNCLKKIKEYAPLDEELHALAKRLQNFQKPYFYQLEGKTTGNEDGFDIIGLYDDCYYFDAEKEFQFIVYEFAGWMYKTLEKEYFGLLEEEVMIEYFEANDTEFDEEGNVI